MSYVALGNKSSSGAELEDRLGTSYTMMEEGGAVDREAPVRRLHKQAIFPFEVLVSAQACLFGYRSLLLYVTYSKDCLLSTEVIACDLSLSWEGRFPNDEISFCYVFYSRLEGEVCWL